MNRDNASRIILAAGDPNGIAGGNEVAVYLYASRSRRSRVSRRIMSDS